MQNEKVKMNLHQNTSKSNDEIIALSKNFSCRSTNIAQQRWYHKLNSCGKPDFEYKKTGGGTGFTLAEVVV